MKFPDVFSVVQTSDSVINLLTALLKLEIVGLRGLRHDVAHFDEFGLDMLEADIRALTETLELVQRGASRELVQALKDAAASLREDLNTLAGVRDLLPRFRVFGEASAGFYELLASVVEVDIS